MRNGIYAVRGLFVFLIRIKYGLGNSIGNCNICCL